MYVIKTSRLGSKRKHIVGKAKTHEKAWALIVETLAERGITPYYYRSWKKDDSNTEQVDYGSHTEFFYIIKT
ncbi:MAG: hypothetical protein NC299_18520 [Lachnospiraceae bacterium]|nr:hypothetical protein [Ruminococcus sp.]MCM1277323.1 hypothetical protein [Lachnospiraceae bacterium]